MTTKLANALKKEINKSVSTKGVKVNCPKCDSAITIKPSTKECPYCKVPIDATKLRL